MNLFSTIKQLWTKEKGLGYSDDTRWLPMTGDESERSLLDRNKEWVYIAADKVATSVASVRYKVLKYKKNGDDQEVFSGPLIDFLAEPGEGYTMKDFVYLDTVYKELTGNAFWEKDGKKLIPMIPTNVQPILSPSGVLTGYKYSNGSSQRKLTIDDVLHDRYIDPQKPYWGVGKLQKIIRWVDTSNFANEFLRGFFVNGARFGGFIKTEEESQERIKLIKAGLNNDHVGVANAHKIGVLPKGSEFQEVTASMSDIEMGATDDRYRDKILSAFGVPKNLLGITAGENRATVEGTEYSFAKYTIKPVVDDFIEFLNEEVAKVLDPTGSTYFACDEFIPVNMDVALKEREIALNRQPYKTVNEVRAEVGLPKVKGGDVIYGNPFAVPLGTPTPSPDAPVDEETPEEDAPDLDEPKKAMPVRMRVIKERERQMGALVDSIVKAAEEKLPELPERSALDAQRHQKFIELIDAKEKLFADQVRSFNDRQKRELIQNLHTVVKAVKKGDLFAMDQEIDILVDFVTPMLTGLMLEQAIEEYKLQEFPGKFDGQADTVKYAVNQAAKRFSKSYNNTTANLLKNALNTGIQEGDSLDQLVLRVNSVYEYSDLTRAAAVARTESVYIANEGSKEAYRQSGVVKTVRWYTAEDEMVCEFCGPMNGEIVGLEETFFDKGDTVSGRDGGTMDMGYRAIDVPPLHTNCRCLIRPEEISID